MDNRNFAIAVNKFFYFSMNYEMDYITYETFGGEKTELLPSFLNANWHCNRAHMIEKWKSICIERYDKNRVPIYSDSYGRIWRFYSELDGDNRMALLEWVNENFKINEDFGINLKEEEIAEERV